MHTLEAVDLVFAIGRDARRLERRISRALPDYRGDAAHGALARLATVLGDFATAIKHLEITNGR